MNKYFNRELSWIEFNRRVLSEGMKDSVPLLERLKFLAIVSSNFDEFFMVRASSVKNSVRSGNNARPSDTAPKELLKQIHSRIHDIVNLQYLTFRDDIMNGLNSRGIGHIPVSEASDQLKNEISSYFTDVLMPSLTPIRIEDNCPVFFSGLKIHIAFLLTDRNTGEEKTALITVPENHKRFFWNKDKKGDQSFTLIEEIIAGYAASLFSGFSVEEHLFFRITKEADMSVDEKRDEDFIQAMEEILISRVQSPPIRLEYSGEENRLLETICKSVGVEQQEVYKIEGPLNLKDFFEFMTLDGCGDLLYPKWKPAVFPYEGEEIFTAVKEKDILLHHPYQSFDIIEKLIRKAAEDPSVMSIKMTLYRTSGDSPIIKSLLKAALNGKHVTVLVELKARFDEKQNITWASRLENAGVIVVYGIARLKVHAKIMMIVRNEYDGIQRYVHLSTGNYNGSTAKSYTDMALLTVNEQIADETTKVLNAITGYANIPGLVKLAMAPTNLKNRILELIRREGEKHSGQSPGLIRAKMNSLADPDVIKALYEASQKGVRIELNIRGICMLVPGIKGMSETIRVVSIIDRFLEHTRAFYFFNQGEEEVYLSSADWMPRNLERRVELMFPVEDDEARKSVISSLELYFSDNQNSYLLNSDGSYSRIKPQKGAPGIRAQEIFQELESKPAIIGASAPAKDFIVRRNPVQ